MPELKCLERYFESKTYQYQNITGGWGARNKTEQKNKKQKNPPKTNNNNNKKQTITVLGTQIFNEWKQFNWKNREIKANILYR